MSESVTRNVLYALDLSLRSDSSERVTVEEVVKGVNIALGNLPLDECFAFDSDGNSRVTVDELVQGVNVALSGCPSP